MSRDAEQRIADILVAIERMVDYRPLLESADPLLARMAYDATLRNLAVIGEAVRTVPETTRQQLPDVPWHAIAGLRNVVVHEYFRIDPEVIKDIVQNELEPLVIRLNELNSG